ncbi:hypothetical protein GPY51_18175 [Photorhabdus laumondii subsp. laumondii]|uniref:Photorhabdus luminescens subsp. laumondii TTO1 complete genome segment 6/17 n=2 Tax=Photorhabdus laumondii subsp. laumondii TaxID=141679 RepID=Q7MB50_PHOLL|nr:MULTISPECIES: hypothetical protein [Photorhabdus]AWK41554.1 hypothetical protein A4R40_08640 [Photorhabdus laumondii subsp. laumondii]AXG42351.1 hypothetical protein PluDJC_08835 [Photorhabdus laumondii subsp. laumondii]AXG46875.1 hypothetical protein PluTT01m_08860 [Photorhabdus laumondii subsp. laumondii]MCC8382796.1 hypothetical protein [Photorhabdus laumondii]MCC8388361.1 hypothetical protein [Photorhabdus laumondii]
MFSTYSSKNDNQTINKINTEEKHENTETDNHLEINLEHTGKSKPDIEPKDVTTGTINAGTLLYKTTAIPEFLDNAKSLGLAEYEKRHKDIQDYLNLGKAEDAEKLKNKSQWAGQYFALEKSYDEYANEAPDSYNNLLKNAGKDLLENTEEVKVFLYTFKVTKDIKVLKPHNNSNSYYVGDTEGWEKAKEIMNDVQSQSEKNDNPFPELKNLEDKNFLLEELGEKGYAWMGPLHAKEGAEKGTEFSYELAISPNLLRQHLTLESEELLGTYKNRYGYWDKK